MRTLPSTSTSLAIRVGVATLLVAPAGDRAHSRSLTAIGKVTRLTATGAFSALGVKLGDPYEMTLTFDGGGAIATFGQSHGTSGRVYEAIAANTDGDHFTTKTLPLDYSLGGSVAGSTGPNGAGAWWQMVLVDNTSDAFAPNIDPGPSAIHDIDLAMESFYQFGFAIRANSDALLGVGRDDDIGSSSDAVVLNGGAPDQASWALRMMGGAGIGVMARARLGPDMSAA